jgi:sec-independent protein translocase protein TatA
MGHIPAMDTLSTTIAFIDGLGAPEMMLIFVLVLVLFGGQKLPEFARGLGKSIREFKKAAAGVEEEFKRALEEDERKQNAAKYAAAPVPALPAASPTPYDPAGPDAYTPQYDEYGHEITPSAETPDVANPVTPATPAATPTAAPANASDTTPTAPGTPGATTPAPASPANPPSSPAASSPTVPPAPPATPPASGTPGTP